MQNKNNKSKSDLSLAVQDDTIVAEGEPSVHEAPKPTTKRVLTVFLRDMGTFGPSYIRQSQISTATGMSIQESNQYGVSGFSVMNKENDSNYFVPMSNVASVELKYMAVQ